MTGFLIFIGVGIAFGVLAKAVENVVGRREAQRPGGARLPGWWGSVGALSLGAAGSALVLGMLGPPSRLGDLVAWVLLIAAFSAPGLFYLGQAANWRLWVDPEGFQVRGAWGALRPLVRWSTVERVKSNGTLGHMVFHLRSGRAQRIPFGVEGLLEALEQARKHGAKMDDRLLDEVRLARSGIDDHARRAGKRPGRR